MYATHNVIKIMCNHGVTTLTPSSCDLYCTISSSLSHTLLLLPYHTHSLRPQPCLFIRSLTVANKRNIRKESFGQSFSSLIQTVSIPVCRGVCTDMLEDWESTHHDSNFSKYPSIETSINPNVLVQHY